MNCPLCLDSVLDVTYHSGIELDICPTCRGVWLDRGELDRIAAGARADDARLRADMGRPRPSHDDRRDDRRDDRYDDRYDDEDDRSRDDRGRKKRKKSLASRLGDVFEEIIDL